MKKRILQSIRMHQREIIDDTEDFSFSEVVDEIGS